MQVHNPQKFSITDTEMEVFEFAWWFLIQSEELQQELFEFVGKSSTNIRPSEDLFKVIWECLQEVCCARGVQGFERVQHILVGTSVLRKWAISNIFFLHAKDKSNCKHVRASWFRGFVNLPMNRVLASK